MSELSFSFPTGSMGPESGSITKFSPPVGSLFSLSKDRTPTKRVTNVTLSNGLAWSKEELYYIDSAMRTVEASDFDAESGKICKYP